VPVSLKNHLRNIFRFLRTEAPVPAFDGRIVSGAAAAIPPGLLLCALVWGPDLSKPLWGVRCLDRALPEERRRGDRAEEGRRVVLLRTEARRAVARDLADGRLTLPEAAARMRDLDRHAPGFHWEGFRFTYAGASDDERHCREAICWVATALPPDDPRAEDTVRRLEAELRQHVARGGPRLPQSDGSDAWRKTIGTGDGVCDDGVAGSLPAQEPRRWCIAR
jgi:hypothetical protein